MVPAAWVAGLVLFLAACVPQVSQQTVSPPASPSTAAVTPSTAPTPAESPTASASPTAIASPSPAKLIIQAFSFHLGEVGVGYGTVTVVAAGGVKPYKWSISSGAFPPGVVLSSSGKATGKPTTTGTFSFVVRVDDSAGGAAGAPSSILVFRQIVFTQTTGWRCGNSTNNCSPSLSGALQIPYTGGLPGGKPKVKITSVVGGSIGVPSPAAGCASPVYSVTTSPPPGMTASASGGILTIAAGPPDMKTWCQYSARSITFVLVDQSPCGSGLLCTSRNSVSVLFGL